MLALFIAATLAQDAGTLEIDFSNRPELDRLDRHPALVALHDCCLPDLTQLPVGLRKLTHLRELVIDNGNGNIMNPVLPEWLGELQTLEKLVLYGAQDPEDAQDTDNKLLRERHPLPASLGRLKNLTYLDLGRNSLSEIPPFVKELSHLRELHFDFNELKEVPAFVGELSELRVLSFGGNQLTDVPKSLERLPHLTTLSLFYNCAIVHNRKKMTELKKRFPKVKLDFTELYECPAK